MHGIGADGMPAPGQLSRRLDLEKDGFDAEAVLCRGKAESCSVTRCIRNPAAGNGLFLHLTPWSSLRIGLRRGEFSLFHTPPLSFGSFCKKSCRFCGDPFVGIGSNNCLSLPMKSYGSCTRSMSAIALGDAFLSLHDIADRHDG